MNALHLLPQPLPRYLEARYQADDDHTLWLTLPESIDGNPPHFAPALLHELRGVLLALQARGVAWPANGTLQPVHYLVLRSANADYFSLGGDLAHFRDCIERRDRDALHAYSMQCAEMVHQWSTLLGREATTIALVQGRALGGGFETALAADLIVAEEQSEFGFPEILFGLFPCTGGMSLLAQRIGARAAEKMLGNGRIYPAAALLEMGVIDEICPRGQGVATVERLIEEHARQRPARLMLQRGRQRLAPLDLQELRTVVDEWTELAMALGPQELRVMEMLVKMQRARSGS
jgi:DSF synthase